MKNLSLVALLSFFSLFAEEQTQTKLNTDISRISEAFGHIIGKNLENVAIQFDMAYLIKGIEDAAAGKHPPMSKWECVQAISSVQEKMFLEQSKENLKQAEKFLAENAKMEGVIVLEGGKVQYRIIEQGDGAVVKAQDSPLIRYTVKVAGSNAYSVENAEERVCLDEAIPGLRTGLVGVREGEKRTIYIHPHLAYGRGDYLFPPNSLLSFEIEILKADKFTN
jgi:peptidylprolyl isomerase